MVWAKAELRPSPTGGVNLHSCVRASDVDDAKVFAVLFYVLKSSCRVKMTCRGSVTWRGRKKEEGVKKVGMPECSGTWIGDGGGSWGGSFDDSNMIALQRETAGVCNDITIDVSDIKQQVFGAYGFQASWDLLRGAQVSWQAWLGVSQSGHDYQWMETARQVDGTNQIAAANAVDLAKCLQKLAALQLQVEQVQTTCNTINLGVGQCLTQIAAVRDFLTAFKTLVEEFRDAVYLRFYRLVGVLCAFFEAWFLPLYRVCKADQSAEGRMGQVRVNDSLEVENGFAPRASDVVITSYSVGGTCLVEARKLEEYGLFHPVIGDNDYYYSSELRQVIARPYRNSGQVYLG